MAVWILTPNSLSLSFNFQQLKSLSSSYTVGALFGIYPTQEGPDSGRYLGLYTVDTPLFFFTDLELPFLAQFFEVFPPSLSRGCESPELCALVLHESITVSFFLNFSVHGVTQHVLSGKKP